MGGDHLDDVALLTTPRPLVPLGHREVFLLAIALRERLVRHPFHEILQEPVLTTLGRAGVGLHRQDLLPHQLGKHRLHLRGRHATHRDECFHGERLAEHRRVLEHMPRFGPQPVKPRGDQPVQALRDFKVLDRAGEPVDAAGALEQRAIEQHPHRLHGIERHALRTLQDLLTELVGEPRNEFVEKLLHGVRRQWLEEH